MKHNELSVSKACSLAIAVAILIFASRAWASGPTETTLYTFLGSPDGANPAGPVIFDKTGNIYGATTYGGEYGAGAAFELTPPSGEGDPWTETILYSFGSDGAFPSSGLVIDSKGALYGELLYDGACDTCGAVFKLTPPAKQGDPWTESTICQFGAGGCSSGVEPSGGLVFDKKGNLYGTAEGGGTEGCCGIVFELIKPSGKGTTWTEKVLYTFNGNENGGSDGYGPETGVTFDKAGNLYGTTYWGGDYSACQGGGCGTVFELSPQGGYWVESILYSFQGTGDGAYYASGLVLDKLGALYGTTAEGEGTGNGNVFKLAPPEVQGGAWTETVLYNFQGFNDSPPDGYTPAAGVIFDGKNLFGTTEFGGSDSCWVNVGFTGCGTVFELTPPKAGTGPWAEKILWRDTGSDPNLIWPASALTLKDGAFYGTTGGGTTCQFSCGGVFELVP